MVSVLVIGPGAKAGDCAVAPLTPLGAGTQVNVFTPVVVEAVRGRLRVLPLHRGAGAVVVTTGSGFTAMLNVVPAPTQPKLDFGVIR